MVPKMSKTKTINIDMISLLSCDLCDFDTENQDDLEKHIKRNIHSVNNKSIDKINLTQEEVYICGECSAKFETYNECESHSKEHISRCYKCDFQSDNAKKLKDHERNDHDLLKCERKNHDGKCKTTPVNRTASENNTKVLKSHCRHGFLIYVT